MTQHHHEKGEQVPVYGGEGLIAYAVVDPDDLATVNSLRWGRTSVGYIHSHKAGTYIHRLVMGRQPGDGTHVDHRDGDPLNNKRSNLRVCTPSENGQNRAQWRSDHGYRGVFHTSNGTWFAHAIINRERVGLGTYATEREAALAAAEYRAAHMPLSPEADRRARGLPLLYMGPLAVTR